MPRLLSDDAVPAWVHTALQRWGVAKRRIWLGGYQWSAKDLATSQGDLKRPDATRFHMDGYSSRSVFAKIRDEREGAGTSRVSQHWPEVMQNDALEVQRAILGMPAKPFDALHLLYVFDRDLTVQQKAEWLECSVPAFYAAASRGRVWVHARIESAGNDLQEFDLSKIIGEIMRRGLQAEALAAITSQNRAEAVGTALNFQAMARPKLSLKRQQAVSP